MLHIIFLATQLPAMQSCLMSQIISVERDNPVILSDTSVKRFFLLDIIFYSSVNPHHKRMKSEELVVLLEKNLFEKKKGTKPCNLGQKDDVE